MEKIPRIISLFNKGKEFKLVISVVELEKKFDWRPAGSNLVGGVGGKIQIQNQLLGAVGHATLHPST